MTGAAEVMFPAVGKMGMWVHGVSKGGNISAVLMERV